MISQVRAIVNPSVGGSQGDNGANNLASYLDAG